MVCRVLPHMRFGSVRRCFEVALFALLSLLLVELNGVPSAFAQDAEAIQPGEAFLTRFSGTVQRDGQTVINPEGTSGSILDIRTPGQAPQGGHWWDEPQRSPVTAAQVGQVFGVAIDDDGNIYLSATSAFGLHRTSDNGEWMSGMWGAEGGPGTIYKLDAAQGYQPRRFADIALDGRANSGAALGNIAYDRWNKQLFVSDLETGMIHRLSVADGAQLGAYDHGQTGRASFTEAATGESQSLPQVGFDPVSGAQIADCPGGAFANTPACWNVADFRRRVWGLGVRRDEATGAVRLYYSVWGSQGFGNADWADAGEDQKNTVWSIGLTEQGDFDTASIRREFTLPDFFINPDDIAAHGASHPVTDIAFPALSDQTVMVLAERGGLRNLGLNSENAFAFPHQARALRYELQEDGTWQPAGRYDVGYYDRRNEGQPFLRANSAGGASFGYGYNESFETDPAKADQWIWLSGDSLCSPQGMCFDSSANEHNDVSEVHGLQGTDQANSSELLPEAALQPYPDSGYATPAETPDRSAMIDADINVDETGNAIEEELFRNDATRIGDVEIFQIGGPGGVETAESTVPAWPVPLPDLEPYPGPWPPEDGGFDLAIDKIGPAECQRNEMCAFTIRITNRGPDPFDGPLFVIEDLPVEITDFTVAPAAWACEPNEGSLICEHEPLTLEPGASVDLLLNLRIPADWAETEFRNCALIGWPLAGEMSESLRNRWVEMALFLTGVPEYDPGAVDGIIDAEAEAAIRRFQEDNGLAVTGTVTEELRLALFGSNGLLEGDLIAANDQDCEQTPIPQVDLAVQKRAVGECRWGDQCEFEVTITNVGSASYEGGMGFKEMNLDAAGERQSPYGPITASTAGWFCRGPFPALRSTCRLIDGNVRLEPGSSMSMQLSVDLPNDYDLDKLTNCARIIWDPDIMGHAAPDQDANERNDEDCAEHIIEGTEPNTGPVEPLDLAISKVANTETCERGRPCDFRIDVRNNGPAAFVGRLAVGDYAENASRARLNPALIQNLSVGRWMCSDIAGDFKGCFTIAPFDEVRLERGEEYSIGVRVAVPEDYADDTLSNCTWLNWTIIRPGGDSNAGNDRSCVEVRIVPAEGPVDVRAVDLDVDKISRPDECRPGAACEFLIAVRNVGPSDYTGPLVIDDVAGQIPGGNLPGSAVEVTTAGWTCAPEAGFLRCTHNGEATLAASGAPIPLGVRVTLPEGSRATELWNCASLASTELPDLHDINLTNNRSCVRRPVIHEEEEIADRPVFDLAVTKQAVDEQCSIGGPCSFTIRVTNNGPDVFERELSITDELPRYASWTASAPWTCDVTGSTATCTHPSIRLGAGEHVDLEISGRLPGDPPATVRNCASFNWEGIGYRGDGNVANDRACAEANVTTLISNLSLRTQALGTCRLGAPCNIGMRIRNTGRETFVGELGIDGRIEPALRVRQISALGPGWSCQVTGAGAYQCRHNPITLAPGAQQSFRISAVVPADLTANEITHTVQLVWVDGKPDADAKDDVASVTIPLQEVSQPVAPPVLPRCTGGRYWNGKTCVCRQGYEWNGRQCQRIREVICRGGTVQDGTCVCPEGWRRTRDQRPTGHSIVFRCNPPAPQIRCINGDVRNNRCYCPKGWSRRRVDTNTYRCERPQVRILCEGGKVRDNRCYCPRGWRTVRRGTNAFRCVRPQAQKIRCVNGAVRNGQCICPKGWRRLSRGRNNFRCVRPQAQISCAGGTVRGGRCVCRRGYQARRIGRNTFRCVRSQGRLPQARIICSGGRVQKGRCVCPAGKVARRVGTNRYQCVWRAPD
jgi:hypothetical protein